MNRLAAALLVLASSATLAERSSALSWAVTPAGPGSTGAGDSRSIRRTDATGSVRCAPSVSNRIESASILTSKPLAWLPSSNSAR